ncbi:hypothetical protein [Cellulosimicrobium funkei]|uniref:hypothetical protein n=1 Tax=Cellulosimicrobium funkei TaxID=264251 RepID=UPI003416BE4C
MSLRPLDALDKIIERNPRENTYQQVNELVAFLQGRPSFEALQQIRRDAYKRFDERGRA